MHRQRKLREAPEDADHFLAERLRQIFDEGNFTQEELAKELDVTQPHVSRLLAGKTAWRKKYLHRFARLYNLNLNALVLDEQYVPIVGHLENDRGFEYADINKDKGWIGEAPAPPAEYNLEGLYCLQIKGGFFAPLLSPGSLIYARQNPSMIQENMLVIYVDENGRGLLKQLKFNNDTIILKSLSTSGNTITRPRIHLRILDKVEWIKI